MWREFPDDKKEPYLEKTKHIKEENEKRSEAFRRKLRQYEADVDDFRKRWKEENATGPSDEEIRLTRILQEADSSWSLKKRSKK